MVDALLRVRVDTVVGQLERVVGIAMSLGAQGVEVCDEETHAVPPGRIWIHAWHGAAQGRLQLEAEYGASLQTEETIRIESQDADWRAGLIELGARPLGRGFEVVEAAQRTRSDRTPIYITAGMGFGDGAHPTTQCCVDLMERLFASRSMQRVLDVGTGSGVLAIVAARLGASEVIATDIDGVAREGAESNIARNQLTDTIRVLKDIPQGVRAELVVANLYLGVLTALMPDLVAATRPGGVCVISGITIDGESLMIQLMEAQDFVLAQRTERDGWLGLAFRHAGQSKESG